MAGQNLLALMAFAMVATFMVLIMTGRLTAMVALILVPTAFGLLAGFGPEIGKMMLAGVKDLAPTGVMLVFAIIYFGLMIDAGLFDPLTARIVALVHGDPVRILVGTAVIAMFISLDGDGATTYMITTAAMIPLYRHLRMDPRKMAAILVMSSAVMNILPWGGPTARVISVLKLDAEDVFVPVIPAMAMTAAWVVFVAWRFGIAERRRLASLPVDAIDEEATADEIIAEDVGADLSARRPHLWWANFVLTLALLLGLVLDAMPLPVLFMMAVALALTINYPGISEQRDRIANHAGNALAVGGMIFAAGIFTGILSGTGMVQAMSRTVTSAIPAQLGPFMAPITAVLSAPFTYFISNDAFYFGVLPILAETGQQFGLTLAQIGRASLTGQQVHLLSPLVPSTYLLAGLSGIEFGELVRTTIKWALGSFTAFFLACLVLGVFPFGVV